jgi:hypothetical protein
MVVLHRKSTVFCTYSLPKSKSKRIVLYRNVFLHNNTCNCNVDVILAQPLSWTVESDGPIKQSDIPLSPPHCEGKVKEPSTFFITRSLLIVSSKTYFKHGKAIFLKHVRRTLLQHQTIKNCLLSLLAMLKNCTL